MWLLPHPLVTTRIGRLTAAGGRSHPAGAAAQFKKLRIVLTRAHGCRDATAPAGEGAEGHESRPRIQSQRRRSTLTLRPPGSILGLRIGPTQGPRLYGPTGLHKAAAAVVRGGPPVTSTQPARTSDWRSGRHCFSGRRESLQPIQDLCQPASIAAPPAVCMSPRAPGRATTTQELRI